MKTFRLATAGVLLAIGASAQTPDTANLHRIKNEILMHGTCYDNLRVLCKQVGHRLSGSPAAAKAVQWGIDAMQAAGADKVYLQPAWVPHWERGKEWLQLQLGKGGKYVTVPMLSLGNSQGTDGREIDAPIIMVNTLDELNALSPEAVQGKIVFCNYRFRQDLVNTFNGYGDAIWLRGAAPSIVGSKGGAAVIIRSLSTGIDDYPHTGTLRYVDSIRKIPGVSVGNMTADKLETACNAGTINAKLVTSSRMLDSVLSYNVIGELRGTDYPDEVITAGGHLDSWDVGEGANDDGAGCVQSIEILHAIHASGLRPKRTIRAVLFMNEENGARGGRAYEDTAANSREKYLLALESDAGGFSPRGIGLEMPEHQKDKIRAWQPYFRELNVYDFSLEESGTDIGPMKKLGVPLAGLMPDSQRYFDVHHTNNDVFENVNHRELKLGAAAMAYLVWLVSEHGL